MPRAKVEKGSGVPYAEYVIPVLPGTPEAEALLRPAYQLTVEEAEELIRARVENPTHVPWDVYQKAKAFMANYSSKPGVTSTRPGWKRGPRPM